MADSVGGPVFPRTGIQEGHLHFDKVNNILYVYNGGNPAVDANWSEVGGSGASGEGIGTTEQYMDPRVLLYDFEDFISKSSGAGDTTGGKHGWATTNSGTGGIAHIGTAIIGHPGVIQMTTGAAPGGSAQLTILSPGVGAFHSNELFTSVWMLQVPTVVADTIVRFGCADEGLSPFHGVYFEKDSAETAWFAVTENNNVPVRITTGIAVDAGYHRFKIRRITTTTVGFTIDNNTELVRTFAGPTGAVVGIQLSAYIESIAGTDKLLNLDFADILITGLSR